MKKAILLLVFVHVLKAQQKLLLVGGGDRTPDVLQKFVDYSGGEVGNILIITWAGGSPEASFESIKQDLNGISKIAVLNAPMLPMNPEKKAILLKQLETAKGVFFTGGDQNRITDVLADQDIYDIFNRNYDAGVAFGGSSAGTAIMSEIMITGEGNFTVMNADSVETKKGLGLAKGIIVDQHFIKRQRQNRLMGLVWKHPDLLGVGIDEDTALAIENNRLGMVLGDSQVLVFEAKKNKKVMTMTLLSKGEKYDLKNRKPVKN